MKKRMVLFLMGFALVATAFSTPAAAGPGLLCPHQGFACFIGPVCCFDQQCAAFCENLSPGSIPYCSGGASDPGCCSCNIEEL